VVICPGNVEALAEHAEEVEGESDVGDDLGRETEGAGGAGLEGGDGDVLNAEKAECYYGNNIAGSGSAMAGIEVW
jgi:hypothetical protein